jgi:hypothetical protein
MNKRLLEGIFIGCLASFIGCATTQPVQPTVPATVSQSPCNIDQPIDQYMVVSPNVRVTNPDNYFCREREQINTRRKHHGLDAPAKNEIGLAFSGGGIRSHAFHLGFLNGLFSIDFLKKVDYISAVSGGSWAAGAYKAFGKEDKVFFDRLDEIVSIKGDLKPNDPKTRPLFNSYEKALADIVHLKLDFGHTHVGFRTQENWRKMLCTNVLDDNDLELKSLDEDKAGLRTKRPFIIFNSTHDANYSRDSENIDYNFPFEVTSNYVGTTADCGNTEGYCSIWDHKYRKCLGVFTSTRYTELAPLSLSYAMAMSGAVIPSRFQFIKLDIMDWTLPIPEKDPKQGLHREQMVITDGGHSDNLGLLALMERHVPRIIVTDMAFDPKNSREDLAVITQHADKLLGMKIEKDDNHKWADRVNRTNPAQKTEQNAEQQTKEKERETYTYNYSWKDSKDKKDIIGTILYIKPRVYKQKNGIQDYLLTPETSHLRTYLDIDLDQNHFEFPTDKTFAYSYEYYLIFSYYMLGRYFATDVLAPELAKINWNEINKGAPQAASR